MLKEIVVASAHPRSLDISLVKAEKRKWPVLFSSESLLIYVHACLTESYSLEFIVLFRVKIIPIIVFVTSVCVSTDVLVCVSGGCF